MRRKITGTKEAPQVNQGTDERGLQYEMCRVVEKENAAIDEWLITVAHDGILAAPFRVEG